MHVVPRDAWGGTETAARSAAEADELGCDFALMFLAGQTLAKNRSRIIDHPGRKLNSPITYIAAVPEIIRYRPDVLVCSLWRSMIVGLFVKLFRPRTRLVCFLHNTITEHFADRLVHQLALRKADEVWADSPATLQARCGGRVARTRVISMVTRHFESARGHLLAPRFVNWSRLHPQKGHDRAIRVVHGLVARGIDAQLEVWGADNGAGPELKDLVERLGLQGHVKFPGVIRRQEIPPLASRNAFFLQLSRYEGMAMAVVEAMQLGLVPVVTPVGQIAEYVRDNQNGILVDPENIESTVDRLVDLLADRTRFEAISRAAAAAWESHPLYAADLCDAATALAMEEEKSVGSKR